MRILILIAHILLLASCGDNTSKATTPTTQQSADVAELKRMLAQDGDVLFISDDGQMHGFDHDLCIDLKPNNAALITQCGFAATQYETNYQLRIDGIIDVTVPKGSWEIPQMQLLSDGTGLFMKPIDAKRDKWYQFRALKRDESKPATHSFRGQR